MWWRACWLSLALVACGPAAQPPVDARPDVLVFTLDTTRRDAMGAYGRSPSPTPVFDALARRGLLVERAMSVTPLTLPSHSSMFTGLYPDRHGVRDNGQFLGKDDAVLAERLSEQGWQTGAFVSSAVLDASFGLARGFDTYVDNIDLASSGTLGAFGLTRSAEQVNASALEWLDTTRPDAPLFAWVHYYDAHEPLAPPADTLALFPDDPYLAEVARVDRALGQLISAVQRMERGRGLVIAVLADHGEGHGEHGERAHGQFVYRSTMDVPMLLVGPGVEPGASMNGASVADVAPTVLELAGLAPIEGADGRSLLRKQDPSRLLYGESMLPRAQFGLAELRVLQGADERYIHAPRPELYDLRADPQELNPIGDATKLGAWSQQLERFMVGRPAGTGPRSTTDPTVREALARLGYLAGEAEVDPTIPMASLPDPKDHPDLMARFVALVWLARSQTPDNAIPLLRAFLEDYPNVQGARSLLVTALLLAGRAEEALPLVEEHLLQRPDDPVRVARLGEVYLDAERVQDAVELLSRAVELEPGYAVAYALLAEAHRRDGDCGAALKVLDRADAKTHGSSRLHLVRAMCLQQAEQWAASALQLERVLSLDPRNADAPYLLGMAHVRQGRVAEALPLFEMQVQRTPDAPLARASLGMALYSSGRFAEALPHLLLSAPHAAVGAEPAVLLADSLLRTGGDLDEAERWLDVASERDPEQSKVQRVRAAVLMERGDVQGALDAMTSAGMGR